MKRITITIPDGMPFNDLAIFDIVEPGASGHTLMVHHSDTSVAMTHSRLGVTIMVEQIQ